MSQMHVNDGGVLRRVIQAFVNDGGVLRRIRQWYLNDGGVLRRVNFAPAITDLTFNGDTQGTASPQPNDNTDQVGGGATSQSVTVTPVGGTGPFTYDWSPQETVNGGSGAVAINTPLAASTTATSSGILAGGFAYRRCSVTVTDSLGQFRTEDFYFEFQRP